MPPVSGVAMLLRVENPGSPGTYRTLAGQRNAKLNRSTDEADATSKDSSGWHEGLPVIRNWSIEADALLIEGDAAYGDLETAWQNNTRLNVRVVMPNAQTYTGLATITDFPIEGPHDDLATIAVTLVGSGALTKA